MNKEKTKNPSKKSSSQILIPYIPHQNPKMQNSKLVAKVLLDCIKENDIDSFKEVLSSYIKTVNKKKFAEQTGLARGTIYNLVDPKDDFMPKVDTVSIIISKLNAS